MIKINLDDLKDQFETILEEELSSRKDKIVNMFFGSNGIAARFYSGPASTMDKYHGCFTGGLLKHSLNVYSRLNNLVKSFDQNFDKETIAVVSLLHDIGKIGDENNSLYVPEESDWHRNKLGRLYKQNENIIKLPHSARSIYILQTFGISLSVDEFQAILYHDGLYTKSGKEIMNGELNLTLLLHWADHWSAMVDECEDKNDK